MSNIDICLNCFNSKKGFEVCPSCGWYDGAEPENAYHLYPGSILRDRYLVGMSVGFGGFGITYKAWDNKLGTIVAIKEFYPSGLVNRVPHEKNVVVYSGERENQFHEQKKRFLDEARTMSKFTNHPNIVHVFDFFEENNTAYIVMEYLDGISAKKYLEQCGGKLDQRSAVDIMISVLDALSTIHSKKIVHRDISPDNIFLTLDNKIKLLDLGAARLTNSEKEETISVVIKPGYAPPEQYRSKSKQGPWTDIYGVGATLYKFLTGNTPEESIDRSVKDTLKKPSSTGAEVDNSLDRIVMKSMALKPELRFQSAQQMKNALVQQKEVDFPEDELKKRKVLRNVLISAVSALSVILVTSVVLFTTVLKPLPTLGTVDIQPAAVSVLLPAENQAAFDSIIEKFNTEYKSMGCEINATYVTTNEYTTQPATELPALIITEEFDDKYMAENLLPLDMLIRSVENTDYVFGKKYEKLYPSKLEVPLGFDILVAYANTSAAKKENITLPDEFKNTDMPSTLSGKLVVGKNNYSQFLRLYDANAITTGESGVQFSEKANTVVTDLKGIYSAIQYKNGAFPSTAEPTPQLDPVTGEQMVDPATGAPMFTQPAAPSAAQNLAEGKCIVLVDDASSYSEIQNTMAGYYKIIPVKSGMNLIGEYTLHFGVNKHVTENEQYIAQLFLAYCLGDAAQNVLHVQNHASKSLPINNRTLETYTNTVYNEFKFITSKTTKLDLLGEARRLYIQNNSTVEQNCYSEAQ